MAETRETDSAEMPVGAEVDTPKKRTHFRVWAPKKKTVEVVLERENKAIPLTRGADGYFSGWAANVLAGAKYKYRLEKKDAYPDPASRFQSEGPHGFSAVVDQNSFRWSDENWRGLKLEGQVIYEMHLGTFTKGGTWAAAGDKLEYLRDTGVTLLEVMPVSEFPGRFGWGYDGVQPFAPASIYGTPDDMRAFVNRAHELGLGVLLDVVYNHLGPDGNYFSNFAAEYFTDKYDTDWGPALNFDGEENGPVRSYFCENAAYWIRDFHLDGLRLDATQDMHDESELHIIAEIGAAARKAAGNRSIILIAENEPQETRLVRAIPGGGYGLDALWNDDYHHSAMVALTGKADAYYSDYRGAAQEFVSAMKYGYLFQGQYYRWQKKRRGSSTLGLPRSAMVTFIQNHDQVANSARGQRVHELTSPGMLKAVTALTLLGPGTPMLFQGQEFASSSPFLFFADHKRELAEKVKQGRAEFLEQWRSLTLPDMKQCLDDPAAVATFERSILDHSEIRTHAQIYSLHRDLLRLRKEDPVLSRQGQDGIDGAVLSTDCFVLRFFSPDYQSDRLLVVNLGTDVEFNPAPEPLLGPPEGARWRKLWSSDDPQYGGCGTAPLDSNENWKIPGQCAVVLFPRRTKITTEL